MAGAICPDTLPDTLDDCQIHRVYVQHHVNHAVTAAAYDDEDAGDGGDADDDDADCDNDDDDEDV